MTLKVVDKRDRRYEEPTPILIERPLVRDSEPDDSIALRPMFTGDIDERSYKARQEERAITEEQYYRQIELSTGNPTLADKHIEFEFEKRKTRFKPIQHDFSDGFVFNFLNPYLKYRPIKYKMAKTIGSSDGFVYNGTIWKPNRNGGLPPTPPMISPPNGSSYYQQTGQAASQTVGQAAGQKKEAQSISSVYGDLIKAVKMNIYQGLTGAPITIRDVLMGKINSWGKLFDYLSSFYQWGADCGIIQAMSTDFLCDRLELIVNDKFELLNIRIYNSRKETPLNQFLLDDTPIPLHGRPANKDDMDYTPGGLVVYKLPQCGGNDMVMENLTVDGSFKEYGALDLAVHGDTKIKGINISQLQKNMIEFTLSHYIYGRTDLWEFLQEHPESKEKIYRITLPRGYGPHNWDGALAIKTGIQAFVGAVALHAPFAAAAKIAGYILPEERAEKYALDFHQREVNANYIPRNRVITKGK